MTGNHPDWEVSVGAKSDDDYIVILHNSKTDEIIHVRLAHILAKVEELERQKQAAPGGHK